MPPRRPRRLTGPVSLLGPGRPGFVTHGAAPLAPVAWRPAGDEQPPPGRGLFSWRGALASVAWCAANVGVRGKARPLDAPPSASLSPPSPRSPSPPLTGASCAQATDARHAGSLRVGATRVVAHGAAPLHRRVVPPGATKPPAGAGGCSQGWFCGPLRPDASRGRASRPPSSVSVAGPAPLTRQVRPLRPVTLVLGRESAV
jgi:hypothetical protein